MRPGCGLVQTHSLEVPLRRIPVAGPSVWPRMLQSGQNRPSRQVADSGRSTVSIEPKRHSTQEKSVLDFESAEVRGSPAADPVRPRSLTREELVRCHNELFADSLGITDALCVHSLPLKELL